MVNATDQSAEHRLDFEPGKSLSRTAVQTVASHQMKRFKDDDVREVQAGYECGLGLEGFKRPH